VTKFIEVFPDVGLRYRLFQYNDYCKAMVW